MTRGPSRRRVLERLAVATAAGTVALAGCVSRDDDHPPVEADGDDFQAIADMERPPRLEAFPLEIGDNYLESERERVETLLEPIPAADSLADEIPNEAVRQYVDETREEARERLEGLEAESTDYARLSTLRSARRRAGEAEGAYAAAVGDREPEDVREEFDALEAELSATEAELRRYGTDGEAHRAVVVYDVVERRLDAAGRAIESAAHPMPGKSTVEAVGELADGYERAAASLEEGEYLARRQEDVGDRPIDDDLESAAVTLLSDLEDRLEELPSFENQEPARELFDEPVDGTPREEIGRTGVRRVRANYESATDELEEGQLARALRSVHTAETARRAIERLQSASEDGDLERPEDADDVQAAKRDAVEAIETTREETAYPSLVGRYLDTLIRRVRGTDGRLERDAERTPNRTAVRAVGGYAFAAAQARALPEATAWFVAELPQ